jgi:hypothetical protein
MKADQDLPWEGGCRCGQVRFRVSKPPMLTMACHCTGCQRMTSSAYSLSAAFPADGFGVIRGEPVIGGLHGAESHHYFCPHCMSWIFTRNEGLEWFVNVRATLFDETAWFEPYLETWLSEKLSWVEPAARHGFDALPPMEAFDGLIKGYAERIARA